MFQPSQKALSSNARSVGSHKSAPWLPGHDLYCLSRSTRRPAVFGSGPWWGFITVTLHVTLCTWYKITTGLRAGEGSAHWPNVLMKHIIWTWALFNYLIPQNYLPLWKPVSSYNPSVISVLFSPLVFLFTPSYSPLPALFLALCLSYWFLLSSHW